MFKSTSFFNDELGFDSIGEYIAVINKHGLKVIEQVLDLEYDETRITVQGSREQFEAFFIDINEGSWGFDLDELLHDLIPV